MACLAAGRVANATTVTADPDVYTLSSNSYWNGADQSGGVVIQNIHFRNDYNPAWGSWSGFAYSNVKDTNSAGWINQYAVFSPGIDAGGTGNYFVIYDDSWNEADIITLPMPGKIHNLLLNNTTYAALSMRDGDMVAKKFGGPSGDDPDWFLLTIIGRDITGIATGTNYFYLADYRFPDNSNDYIISEWSEQSLTNLGEAVKTLHFSLSSSDNGIWGMNTPSYFAMDNLQVEIAYAPAAGVSNSTAIHMNTNTIQAWATGWTNYNVGPDCDMTWQDPTLATGQAVGTSYDIVCLGRGGEITLTFDTRIANGDGDDFAVFENGFASNFLELGYVEVSSDGTHFYRFPNHSLTKSNVTTYETLYPTNLLGYCSKYQQGYGTPFDLEALSDNASYLNVNNVRWVRIVDIVGDGSCTDSFGNIIYDLHSSYIISASAGAHGSISPSGVVYVAENTDHTFDITPSAGFHIEDVVLNGESIDATTSVMLVNVESNQHISTTFSNTPPSPWIEAPQEGGQYGEGVLLSFIGQAPDPEDGSVSGAGLRWYSDINGLLGTGTTCRSDALAVGIHQISLQAEDIGLATSSVSRTITILADSDADGIPDRWENDYSQSATGMVAQADDDGDGLDNYGEWLAGTCPTNEASCFAFSNIGETRTAEMLLSWQSTSNRIYRILFTTVLDSEFSVFDNVVATPPQNTYTDTTHAAESPIYYRIDVRQ